MTKEETAKKRQETESKKLFVQKATQIVSSIIVEVLFNIRTHNKIQLMAKGYNRYFSLHRYGEDLGINIFQSGDVDVKLKEMYHSEVTIRLVHYEEAAINPESTLQRFQDDIRLFIQPFLKESWRDFMDHMSPLAYSEEEIDWRPFEANFRASRETSNTKE